MPEPPEPRPIRKRMKRREIDGDIRFITFSCQRRLPLLSNPAIADLFADRLAWTRRNHKFKLYAWVLMPEHVHLLVLPARGSTLEAALRSLKLSFSTRVLARWKQVAPGMLKKIDDGQGNPRFWQAGGGFDRNVRHMTEFMREVRYIHRNPVERGLVLTPELWRWSSVRWWMGHRDAEIDCDGPPETGAEWSRWQGFK
jgi:putative transposase